MAMECMVQVMITSLTAFTWFHHKDLEVGVSVKHKNPTSTTKSYASIGRSSSFSFPIFNYHTTLFPTSEFGD